MDALTQTLAGFYKNPSAELVARICETEAKRPGGAARPLLATRAGA
jgi:hypothetical protein